MSYDVGDSHGPALHRPHPRAVRLLPGTASNGQFVGQIAYITGEKALVSIVAKGSMRIISWPRVKLDTFFQRQA